MANYWADRVAATQARLTDKSIAATEKQLKAYYNNAMKRTIADFEATYNKLLSAIEDGKEPTPADLYKLDSYWKMQAQLRNELQKLGDKQAFLFSKRFEQQFMDIYNSFALPSQDIFSTISQEQVQQLINSIWCADGASWSDRVWKNTTKLQEALNEELVHCVITGKKPTDLKKLLIDKFNVSYSAADSLVRTEMAHIQTQAAQQRYKDYGIEEVEVLVDTDAKTCKICAEHEGEILPVNAQMPVPFHPRCRCCIIPVVKKV